MRSIPLVLFCFFLFPVSQARADLASTFDTDAEGWGIYNNGAGAVPDYVSTGGNPGGFIKDTDGTGSTFYFIAPSTWSGDLSGYIGGTLSYEIIIVAGTGSHFDANDVRIWDGDPAATSSAYLYWDSGIDPPKPPGEAWTPFSVRITPNNLTVSRPTGSTATFDSIMADVYALHIRGDLLGATDTVGIDNVSLKAASPASIPTVSQGGMIAFFILLVGSALWVIRKSSPIVSSGSGPGQDPSNVA
jgi:hypothetical protein